MPVRFILVYDVEVIDGAVNLEGGNAQRLARAALSAAVRRTHDMAELWDGRLEVVPVRIEIDGALTLVDAQPF